MPSPGLRKLTITVTIVIVIAAYPARGLPLYHSTPAEVNPGTPTDQASQESFQLEVKNDPRSPNDIQQDKVADTNKATKNRLRFTSELKFIDSTEDTTVNNDKKTDFNKTHDAILSNITTQEISNNKNENPEVATTSISMSEYNTQGIKTTISVNTASSGSTVFTVTESLAKSTDNYYETTTSKTQADVKVFETKTASTESENTTYPHTNEDTKVSEEISTIHAANIHDQIAIDSETTKNLLNQKEPFTNATTESINETETSTTESETETNIMTTSTTPLINPEIKEYSKITFSESTADHISSTDSTTTQSLNDASELTYALNSASTLVELASDDKNPITTEPSWKKYTSIARKRINSSNETSTSTEKSKDLVKAESIQTTLPIPSLQMLREDLLSNAYQPSTVREQQTGIVISATEMMPTLGSIESTQSETLGIVASKRAGFLDLSKRTSAQNEKSSTERNSIYRIYEKNVDDIEGQGIKKVNGAESQSRLADDAINEELMKEEMLNNHEDNLNRYEGGQSDKVKPLENNAKTVDSITSQSITEDSLSVQPINQDRRTTLYTVGPNYKPMKRIEVQPAKSFVRDPDDNSWRNESISSLGIVFKPKNSSSKSYKEVLKNKTETEFNNLQEKDNKGEMPELRVRLEKIAEVRKSKKKRIDKFGEVVYTDYEEGSSAEGTSTAPPENIPREINSSVTLSTKNPQTEVTSPMTTTENQRYWKTKLETINKEEMFKDLGLDILTTAKSKKPYNLAEYYDTTDEYDADYITLPNIDLKKFTVSDKTFSIPPKTYSPLTSPPLPPTTRLVPPRFPDRQPTIQYFPPTTKPQKVNINDYDVNFERRVKQYTLKETPRTMPPFDPENVPVATDQPEIRPTMKPSDFTRYTPDHLNKRLYLKSEPRVADQNFVMADANFNRGIYVIKHFRDFLNTAANDEEKSPNFVPYTETPARGVTLDELARSTEGKTTEDYEYDTQFRKDVISRFVDNFNQNSDRFKDDFPVLFNSSVVHRLHGDRGQVVASSSAFMKRLYGNGATATRPGDVAIEKGCEPNCDNITVELSPAYELHYYVPEQEEKEVADQTASLPHSYKL